jgi:hypothetical protein
LNGATRLNVSNNNVHSAHCRTCKERVREILVRLYGDCRVNHSFPWPARPQAYRDTTIGAALEQIHAALGEIRDHRDFVKSAQVPPCDYYITDPPFILEFDESQHFSRPRLVALTHYPANLQVGFSISGWLDLCREIDAKDDEPFDRDERRAWYDTLRDLVPIVHGFRATVRIYAEEFAWCSLDPASAGVLESFQAVLRDRLPAGIR